MRRSWRAVLAAMALAPLAVVATEARAQDPRPTGDDYTGGNLARLSDVADGVTLVRAYWNDERGVTDEAGLNAPVFPGDRVTTDPGQRVEVELAAGTRVWIGDRTDVTFLALPDPYAEVADHTVLQVGVGALRLAVSLGDGEEFRIDTAAASVYPLGDADLRVEVDDRGRTTVYSRRGVVEVVGAGGSVLVRGGMRAAVDPESLPADPEPFNTFSGDGLDRYVAERQTILDRGIAYGANQEAYQELPHEVRPYYRELSANGSWIFAEGYGYVWQPAGVESDWRPYHDGYWAYGPQGYFWVSHEPWGWAPYHYGRWSWIGPYGWCWSPGSVFGGAWVAWSWGSLYVGWGPLDYWGYPAYYSSLYYGYYDPHCWTFVGYGHFGHHHHHHSYAHYDAGWDQVEHDVRHSAAVTRPPREAPARLAADASARQRAASDLRENPRGRLPRADESRAAARSFRTQEARAPRTADGGLRRSAPAAPEGRARTVPTTGRSSRAWGAPSARDAERGRERVPVVSAPRGSGSSLAPRTSLAPSARGPRTAVIPGAAAQAGEAGSPERVRDIYRRMSKPRQTRDEPATPAPSAGSDDAEAKKPVARPRPAAGGTARPVARPRPRPPSAGQPPAARPRTAPAPRKDGPSLDRAPTATRSPAARPAPTHARPGTATMPERRAPAARPQSVPSRPRSPGARPQAPASGRPPVPSARPRSTEAPGPAARTARPAPSAPRAAARAPSRAAPSAKSGATARPAPRAAGSRSGGSRRAGSRSGGTRR
jgi:hypothetical protein